MDQKLSLSQRGIVHLLAIVIGLGLLAVLAFSLNALFASRTQEPPQGAERSRNQRQLSPTGPEGTSHTATTTTNQSDPTAGWEVYTNSNQHYSIKVPKDWYVYPDILGSQKDVNRAVLFSSHEYPDPDEIRQMGRPPARPVDEYSFSLALLEKKRQPEESLEEYIKETLGLSTVQIDGKAKLKGLEEHQAVKVFTTDYLGSAGIFIENGEDVYAVWLLNRTEEDQPVFEMMISTLSFLK